MIPVFLDFETFWSVTHSLTKMPPTEYVMHPDTEIISLAMKVGTGTTQVYFGEADIRDALGEVPWDDAMAIGHNMSGFDSMLLAWRLGIHPKMWGCTLAMARPRYAKVTSLALGALSKYLHLGNKLDLEATNTKGKHLVDFTEEERNAMAVYNIMDTELCASLFKRLAAETPRAEMHHIDMTVRMLVEPQFVLDEQMVRTALTEVRDAKRKSLLDLAELLGIETYAAQALENGDRIEDQVRAELMSASKFKALLERLGVAVPMKTSPVTRNMIPALAKSDEEFLALQEHDNPIVAAAARARLDAKSTLLESRLEAFLRAATACKGKLPIPLRYCGADTTGRWSGEQYNPQNLPRIPRDKDGNIVHKPSNALRLSLAAPPGHLVVVADLSGIELRVNMFLWKVAYAMALFAADPAKADLYKHFAANDLYRIAEAEVSKQQRQVGKVSHLGLGFGAGGPTFQKVARLMGGVDMDLAEANRVVETYRQAHPEIVSGWRTFQDSIPHIMQGTEKSIDPWGLCVTEKHAVRLPSGRRIHYPSIRREVENGKSEYWYGEGRHKARIYAGKGVENVVQALARDVIADNALQFKRATGLRPALMVHDELVYVVPENDAEDALDTLQDIMRAGVTWWPELITWSEGDVAICYGSAK